MKFFAHSILNCKGLEMIDLAEADNIDIRTANSSGYVPFGSPVRYHGQPSFGLKVSATQKD
jgi:hypothetical protein